MIVLESDRVHQRNEKSEHNAEAKGKANHHQNSTDAAGERAEKPPPIQTRVEIKNPHGAAELRPTMFARQQHRRAKEDEDEADAGAQQEKRALAIFSEKFQHGWDAA